MGNILNQIGIENYIFLSVVLTAKPTANYDTAPVKSEKSTSAPQAPTQKATNLPTTK